MLDRVGAGNGMDGRDGGGDWMRLPRWGLREAVSDRFVVVDIRQKMVVLFSPDGEVCCGG